MRSFRDSSGIEWRVSVQGGSPGSHEPLSGDEWLMFDCGRGRKRLSPIPAAWPTALPAKLDQMCRVAEPMARTRGYASADEVDAQQPALRLVRPDESPTNSEPANRLEPAPRVLTFDRTVDGFGRSAVGRLA
jgi:hypothetical protein